MAKQQRTIGVMIIQLALAVYFVVTAICLLFPNLGSSISSSEIDLLTAVFRSAAFTRVVDIILGILLLACGVVFLIKVLGLDLGKVDDIIKYATLVVWIVITVVALISYVAPDFVTHRGGSNALHWFLALAKNALIIGGILTIKNGREAASRGFRGAYA